MENIVNYKNQNFFIRLISLAILVLPFQSLLAGIIILFVVYNGWILSYKNIISSKIFYGFSSLSFVLIISCIFANKSSDAWLGIVHFIPFFLVFFGMRVFIDSYQQLTLFALPIIINSIPIVILGIGDLKLNWITPNFIREFLGWRLTGEGMPVGRMASVFPYANPLALYLLIALIFTVGLLAQTWNLRKNYYFKILLFLALILNGIGLILTSSRNGWVIAIIAVIAFSIYLSWYFILFLIGGFVAVISWASFGNLPAQSQLRRVLPAFLWLRLSDEMYSDRTVETLRVTQWRFSLNMIKDKPFLGWGLRSFSPLYEAKYNIYLGHPHNFFLMVGAETGLISLLLFSGVIGYIFFNGCIKMINIAKNKSDQIILFTYLTAFGAYIIYNLFDVSLFDIRLNILVWIILAAISGVSENKENRLFRQESSSTQEVNFS